MNDLVMTFRSITWITAPYIGTLQLQLSSSGSPAPALQLQPGTVTATSSRSDLGCIGCCLEGTNDPVVIESSEDDLAIKGGSV